LKNRLRDLKIFECLNAEKACPSFLDIAKKSKTEATIEDIKKDDGTDFENNNDRHEHIRTFYSNLYSNNDEVNGNIADFLGPEICQLPQIKATRLTQTEKDSLDSPLSIEELDRSLKQVNIKSAPGVDGFSYRFIKKFWTNFRIPLFNCATESLENGTMPDFFASAQIKIIPKKGDTSKIKNWRPISLLSNFYKIISRLVNNRLKKITNRVISRGQKGFNQSRQLHEVIINALETMNFCTVNKIKGAVISIDMAKAFDSVAHPYLSKVYEFFGFGERIQKWLRTIGTNRNASIILENGELSAPFNLRRGTAQGDSPSPFIYNLAAQILIWKIELDNTIKGVYPTVPNLPLQPGENLNSDFFAYESNRETYKNESFADDANNFVLLEFESLFALKKVLLDFKNLSGFECNVEKSFIMRIGDLTGEIDQRIIDLGFPFTNEITVLGFILNNQDSFVAKNYEKVRRNVTNLARFWERFNLSLPGKIMVYKTLLLPQINFIATILTPSPNILAEVSTAMENFVTRGIKIGKSRIYLPVEKGGLGMFDLGNFICGLQCSWIKRSMAGNDNWKLTLRDIGEGDPLKCDMESVHSIGLALANIIASYRKFRGAYAMYRNNFLDEKILNFQHPSKADRYFDAEFFGQNLMNTFRVPILNVTWRNLVINGNFTDHNEFEHLAGFHVSNNKYMQLRACFMCLRGRMANIDEHSVMLADFFRRNLKGSKRYRKIIEYTPPEITYFKRLQQVKSFNKCTGTAYVSEKICESNMSRWNFHSFPNRLKVFLFKYYNNLLGTGNRVAHFAADSEAACSFCLSAGNLPAPLETFSHIFFDCPCTEKVLSLFFQKYFELEKNRCNYFTGHFAVDNISNQSVNIVLDCLRYSIWQAKLAKKTLSFYTVELETISLLETLTTSSQKILNWLLSTDLIVIDGRGRRDEQPARRDP